MTSEPALIPSQLKAPKAAAIAGIAFAVLLIMALVFLLRVLPSSLNDGGVWLNRSSKSVLLALNLVPFAGIAFLWFIGVVRDRLGKSEDQFFATVFLGSGLLFLAMLFASAAITGSLVLLYAHNGDRALFADFYVLGGTIARELMDIYGVKMAGVFMISSCTLFRRTHTIPPWLVWLGYALAVVMILRIGHLDRLGWVILAFPVWVLLLSIYLLRENYRTSPNPD